ncbi:transposase [Streptomyces sp. NPDC006476]|uniref:transposase n=1 Tax=Streptomyces sp. NPDC006476 TaxID=3157175 RepID=UPI0033B6C3BF
MGSKYTKRYTEEFERDAIALVDSSGKTVTAVARELGISSESLRVWYRQAKADRVEGGSGELSSAGREELKRLRKQNREQQETIEILKKVVMPPLRGATVAGGESGRDRLWGTPVQRYCSPSARQGHPADGDARLTSVPCGTSSPRKRYDAGA